ncbi:PAS domain-containing sensor histidine kinase [Hymenobacter puniceus]|uniref:PAS domain-containing sensor histidine kinase n=1 Tax=Hymenobacter sp. BT190 TaxID=2763505 RepID=UPI0016510714|nr:PAS domain-containing sensor histidine kinase [Hymenobacter sp. BT190]MBC6699546.1 PAS domain-containing sensor histidine kinase [Hymenobacter sp. BT190]
MKTSNQPLPNKQQNVLQPKEPLPGNTASAQVPPAAPTDQAHDRFRTIFENSPFGQKIISSDLIIRQANQAMLEMLDCTRMEDVVGHRIMEFAHPDHRDDWHFLQQRLWNHKLLSFTLETCLVRADGSSFWCQVTSICFFDGNEELGYTQLEDISDRKALELSLKRLYDMQETVLHMVTHDLKVPIAHIQLLAELLQRELDETRNPKSGQESGHYLFLIRQACADATKLLHDILLLGSLDAGHLKKQPVDLVDLLQRRLATYQLAAIEKGLVLAVELPSQSLPVNLNLDSFGRVIDNLVSNALKFTPVGGHVTVGLQENAGRVLLTVRDTGIGIPEALQANLFEKFTSSARPGIGGGAATGLGLFITRQIVQLHRGKLWVESQEGKGTCFFVELR